MKLGMLLPTTKLVPSECLLTLVIDASSAFLQPITEIADQKCNKTFYPNLPVEYEKYTNHHLIFDVLESIGKGCTWWGISPTFDSIKDEELCNWDMSTSEKATWISFISPYQKQNKKVQVNPCQKNVVTHTHTQTQVGVWVKSPKMWDISTLLVITSTCLICLFPCCICFYKYPITTT